MSDADTQVSAAAQDGVPGILAAYPNARVNWENARQSENIEDEREGSTPELEARINASNLEALIETAKDTIRTPPTGEFGVLREGAEERLETMKRVKALRDEAKKNIQARKKK